MAHDILVIETEDGSKHEVKVFSADYIGVNRELEAEGRRPSLVSQIEYEHRLAHRAGQRAGVVPTDQSFDDWLETGADAERPEKAGEAEESGEARATPA